MAQGSRFCQPARSRWRQRRRGGGKCRRRGCKSWRRRCLGLQAVQLGRFSVGSLQLVGRRNLNRVRRRKKFFLLPIIKLARRQGDSDICAIVRALQQALDVDGFPLILRGGRSSRRRCSRELIGRHRRCRIGLNIDQGREGVKNRVAATAAYPAVRNPKLILNDSERRSAGVAAGRQAHGCNFTGGQFSSPLPVRSSVSSHLRSH